MFESLPFHCTYPMLKYSIRPNWVFKDQSRDWRRPWQQRPWKGGRGLEQIDGWMILSALGTSITRIKIHSGPLPQLVTWNGWHMDDQGSHCRRKKGFGNSYWVMGIMDKPRRPNKVTSSLSLCQMVLKLSSEPFPKYVARLSRSSYASWYRFYAIS